MRLEIEPQASRKSVYRRVQNSGYLFDASSLNEVTDWPDVVLLEGPFNAEAYRMNHSV